jgi:Zn-dependent protease
MNSLHEGSFRLFRLAGITVYLHWTWLLVAYLIIIQRAEEYGSLAWNVAEYLALFGIVLLHEFGHALACRSVGGTADQIVLWPLGGVAYVAPPPRPGAVLWSIAAGPLVNVALVPITGGLLLMSYLLGWPDQFPNADRFLSMLTLINAGLLIFNILPIYPLDGGQILQALLWFFLGRGRSLKIVSVIGLFAAGGLALLALGIRDWWLILIAAFVAWRSWVGFQQARILAQPGVEALAAAQAHLSVEEYGPAIAVLTKALEALEDEPTRGMAYAQRGSAYLQLGDYARAVADFDEAARRQPDLPPVYLNRGRARAALGDYDRAAADYTEALRIDARYAPAYNYLAWLWATCPREDVRNGAKAVEYARRACELTEGSVPEFLATLAAAHAAVGDFAAAAQWQNKALESPDYRAQYGDAALRRLHLYEQGQPYRDEAVGDRA